MAVDVGHPAGGEIHEEQEFLVHEYLRIRIIGQHTGEDGTGPDVWPQVDRELDELPRVWHRCSRDDEADMDVTLDEVIDGDWYFSGSHRGQVNFLICIETIEVFPNFLNLFNSDGADLVGIGNMGTTAELSRIAGSV